MPSLKLLAERARVRERTVERTDLPVTRTELELRTDAFDFRLDCAAAGVASDTANATLNAATSRREVVVFMLSSSS